MSMTRQKEVPSTVAPKTIFKNEMTTTNKVCKNLRTESIYRTCACVNLQTPQKPDTWLNLNKILTIEVLSEKS